MTKAERIAAYRAEHECSVQHAKEAVEAEDAQALEHRAVDALERIATALENLSHLYYMRGS